LEKHGSSFVFEINLENLPQVQNLREVSIFVILYILIIYSKVSKFFDFFGNIFYSHPSEGLEPSEGYFYKYLLDLLDFILYF